MLKKFKCYYLVSILLCLVILLFLFFSYINHVSLLKNSSVIPTLKETNNISEELHNINVNSINKFNISSPTNKLLFISIDNQKLYVFTGYSKNWSLEKEFLCATGLPGTETPKGIFSCNFRGEWFFSNKFNMGAKYYVNFNDCYYIHSVPLYADKNTIAEYTLGCPASHGCVRLSVADSKWIYENVNDGSTIVIP